MSSIALILHRARWQIAALRVRSALVRARLVLLRAYDPNQPRVPAGSQEGGRWTDGDSNFDPGFAPDGGRIVRVAEDGDRRYTVVLAEEEARGGHTLRRHVGRTDKEMLDRVRSSRQDVFFVVSYGLKRDGSFESIESANDFVNRTIELNKSIVDRVSSGKQRDAF